VTQSVCLSGAEVRIGGRRIFGPADLSIDEGQHWVLLGPNGSGKTTALTLMGAWRQPSGGAVAVLGERLGHVDVRRLRQRIGHVSHAVAERLRGDLSVLDTVLTGKNATLVTWSQAFDDDDEAKARTLLEQVGCADLAGRALATCSMGERQRVLIARALFGAHDLLLFDEPAAGLDLPAREQLVEAMTAAAQGPSDRTTVLATHHLEEIPPTATHAALLRLGRIVASGTVEAVLADAPMSACFELPVRVERRDGRWSARVARGSS
jgi:iron complex transport system ATP-binding protein